MTDADRDRDRDRNRDRDSSLYQPSPSPAPLPLLNRRSAHPDDRGGGSASPPPPAPAAPDLDLDPTNLPIAAIDPFKLVALRKCAPDAIRKGDTHTLHRWAKQLELSLLRHPAEFEVVEFRDETVIFMLQLNHHGWLITPLPSITGSAGAQHIMLHQNDSICDNSEFDTHCMNWVAAMGSELYPKARALAIGRILAVLSYEQLLTYDKQFTSTLFPADDSIVFENLIGAMRKMAAGCNFDRTIDWYLHAAMRTYLGISRLAYLLPDDTPMRAIAEDYTGEDTNRIVRGFTSLKPPERFEAAEWEHDYSVILFVTCIAMLRETIDDIVVPFCVNSEIVNHGTHNMPVPFVLTGEFAGDFGLVIGHVYKNTLYCMPQTSKQPVLRAILAWSEMCFDVFTASGETDKASAFHSLNNAVFHPERPLAGDKYGKFFRE